MASQSANLQHTLEDREVLEDGVEVVFLKTEDFIVLTFGLELILVLIPNSKNEARISEVAACIEHQEGLLHAFRI